MGSSRKVGSKILGLITQEEAERLLFDWANLKREDTERFLKRWGGLLGDVSASVFSYQEELRHAWDAPNSRDRSWYLFMIRHSYAFEMRRQAMAHTDAELTAPMTPEKILALKQMMAAPPEISPLEAALYYLQEGIGDRAKHCANVGCRDPYFIAEKRWQKYCSPRCAAPSNVEAKRRWWHENKEKRP